MFLCLYLIMRNYFYDLSTQTVYMSKLSRANKYQRRQKAEKRRLRMEKKWKKSIWATDTESDQETDNVKHDKGIPATDSEVKEFLNGNN